MSNISSIANNYYSTLFETQNTTLPKSSTSINDTNDSDNLLLTLLNNGNIQSNLDGDTFQLTSSTSADNSNISYDFKSGSSDPIRSFLDKVKDGTVTDTDITDMQTILNKLFSSSDSSATNSSDPIRSFLDKVKNGTVTTDDLESMKTMLTQIPQGPPPQGLPPTDNRNSSSDSQDVIGSFLDKVKNGTVTSDDLESMKTTLTQIPQGPPPTDNRNSSSDSQDVIGSFLDKVKNGTVTDSDLTNIRALLNQNLK